MTIKLAAEVDACGREEAAKLLDKGSIAIWRWIRSDKILSVRIGGHTFISEKEVERLQPALGSSERTNVRVFLSDINA